MAHYKAQPELKKAVVRANYLGPTTMHSPKERRLLLGPITVHSLKRRMLQTGLLTE